MGTPTETKPSVWRGRLAKSGTARSRDRSGGGAECACRTSTADLERLTDSWRQSQRISTNRESIGPTARAVPVK